MKSERRKFGKMLVFVILFGTVIALSIGTASVATRYANPGESIQAPVNAASSGDTIMWRSGTYYENVNINKQLTPHSDQYFTGEAASSWARFELQDRFILYSENDTRMSGIHQARQEWILNIYNLGDTVMGGLNCSMRADNITEVFWDEYAEWNETSAKWTFPSDFTLFENDCLSIMVESNNYETKSVPMSISRRMNKSIFGSDGYQLAEFNVTFKDTNFDYAFGDIVVEDPVSIVSEMFSTNAPLHPHSPTPILDSHLILFNFNKMGIQANKTYNFSVIVRVELTDNETSPVMYKPMFNIGVGNHTSAYDGTGRNVTMPSEMLPKHVHSVSASINVSNSWILSRPDIIISQLEEISEPLGPKSEIHVHKEEYLSTYDTHIDHNKIYNFTTRWDANVWEVENLDNVTYTITTTKNFTYIDNWELYKNGTENSFILPPTVKGQNYTWVLPLKDRIGSDINFVLNSSQTVQDNPWVDMDVNTTDEGDYTRVNVTFTPIIPLDWINLHVKGDQIIDVSVYPPEFEIEMLTSSYVMFESEDIGQSHVYNFSVLVDNPKKVKLWLEASFGWVVEPPSNIITLPVAELGNVTVKADVPAMWGYKPILPQYVQSIAIEFEEIKRFDTGSPENPYPSIMGNHTGTIKPNHTVIATKLYTYPCAGTGGHTKYAEIWNATWNTTAMWKGYADDWHNITFDKTVVLLANNTYNYTIRTGSYPQIHHAPTLPTTNGWINCTQFVDANGKEYNDWIPAIRLWGDKNE